MKHNPYTITKKGEKYNAIIKRISRNDGKDDIWYLGGLREISLVKLNGGPLYETSNFFIDGDGIIKTQKVTSPDGKVLLTKFLYDNKNRLVRKIENNTILENYIYNDSNNTMEKFDGQYNLIWKKAFDTLNRPIKIIYADGKELEFEYMLDVECQASHFYN